MKHRVNPDQLASPMAEAGVHHTHLYFEQMKSSIRWKLLVAYITPLICLSVYFHFQYNATLREGIDNHLRSVAEHQRNTVDLFLKERVANLRHTLPQDADPAQLDDAAIQVVLTELQRENPTFTDIGLFDARGKLVSYAGPHVSLLGKDYSEEPWYRALHSGKRNHYVSDVYLGFRDRPHFVVAVRRLIAGVLWTVRASVDPEAFGRFVNSSHLMAEGESCIVNADGERQTLDGTNRDQPDRIPVPVRTEETLVTEFDLDGELCLAALAWLTETDWVMVVSVPEVVAYAPLQRARLVLAGMMIVALALIVLVVLRSTKRMVGRLEATDTAKENLQQQLFNAAKLASVGEMAAGVAHEINNPLAIVYEEAAMMEDLLDPQFGGQLEPDETRERLAEIKAATMRGREITRKLLAFSRRHEPEPEPIDVNLLVERVLETRSQALVVCNIDVEKQLAANLPMVFVNRNQAEQVMLNLVNNARDAISDGGTITIRTRRGGQLVEIDVEDTGSGMSPETMNQIFFPFFTTKGVGRGTGLGLSISYGIVKAAGGRIEVASEVGGGTCFTVSLPAVERASGDGETRSEGNADG